jgi:hypothetical protein
VAGRWGGEREIMRDNECNSETEKIGFEECHVAPGMGPEKIHLAPEVKMADEIVRGHVCDKMYPCHFYKPL